MIVFSFLVLALAAIPLSVVGAYFSIFGLTTIFAGAKTEIMILAIALELAKVLTAAWTHLYWTYISRFQKIYLTAAVLILMFITLLGIYGYMSRSFIENHNRIATVNAPQIQLLDSRITNLEALKKGVDIQIAQIDKSIDQLKGNVALNALKKQRADKEKLTKQQQIYVTEIIQLKQEKTNLDIQQQKIELELGPLKYVAQAIPYVKLDNESVVRFLILLIMFVFDPLAILLVVSTTSVIAKAYLIQEKKKDISFTTNGKYPEVDLDKFFKYNANINPNTVSALDLTKAKI